MTQATIYHDPECDYYEVHAPGNSPIQLPTLAGAVVMAYLLGATDVQLVSDDEAAHAQLPGLIAEQEARKVQRDADKLADARRVFRQGVYRRETSRDRHGQYRGRGEW
jgi:hypothetical protein